MDYLPFHLQWWLQGHARNKPQWNRVGEANGFVWNGLKLRNLHFLNRFCQSNRGTVHLLQIRCCLSPNKMPYCPENVPEHVMLLKKCSQTLFLIIGDITAYFLCCFVECQAK